MGRERGTASRPHAEREDAWPRQREKYSHNITHVQTESCLALFVVLQTLVRHYSFSAPSIHQLFWSFFSIDHIHFPSLFSLLFGLCLPAVHSTRLPVTMENDTHRERDHHDSVWSVRSVLLTLTCGTVGALWPLVSERFNKVQRKKKKAKFEEKVEKNSN